jgi:hypothetical protein
MKKISCITIIYLSVSIVSIAQISEVKILPIDGAPGDEFGQSVSISGDYTIVGARWDDDNGMMSGSAYIFQRDGANWIEEQKLLATDGAEGDQFGFSVSISGDYAIVGARWDDDNGDSSGSAYIYKGFVVDIEYEELVYPLYFSLQQNYPNPFNPNTTIRYDIPERSITIIKLYDVLGNEVRTLVEEEMSVGSYQYELNATELPSGVYFYQLKAVPTGRSYV